MTGNDLIRSLLDNRKQVVIFGEIFVHSLPSHRFSKEGGKGGCCVWGMRAWALPRALTDAHRRSPTRTTGGTARHPVLARAGANWVWAGPSPGDKATRTGAGTKDAARRTRAAHPQHATTDCRYGDRSVVGGDVRLDQAHATHVGHLGYARGPGGTTDAGAGATASASATAGAAGATGATR
jgi:hypothetical protein